MRKIKKIKKKNVDKGILSKIYQDFKNNQKSKEKKELKYLEEQIKKDLEKFKLREKFNSHEGFSCSNSANIKNIKCCAGYW